MRPGGAERVCLHLAREFLARGYAVDVLLMTARGELLAELPDQVRVVDFAASRLRGVLLPLRRYLHAERPAALLALMWPITVIALLASMTTRAGTRIVVSDHNVVSLSGTASGPVSRWLLKITMRWLYPRADAIVAVSHGVADDMAAHTGLPARLIASIHNPATRGSLPVPLPSDDAVGGWRQPGYQRVITVGTLKPEKDQRTLLAAFAKLRKRIPVKLLILGEGSLRADLERYAQELGVAADVSLPGFAPDPYPYYLAADLFVLSSTEEGFGNVLVEAMECGLPVVSTDCVAGPSEILDRGRHGRLVPVGDSDALAAAMQAALEEPPDREALRARAQDFSIARSAQQYLTLLLPQQHHHGGA